MSAKRAATTELNHDNWDQDDPADQEEMGTYKAAPKEVLEKRVIRTARRRTQMSSGDEEKKSVFSGFGGFNKTQPSSFDFLSKLTNGNRTNGSPSNKNENTVSSSIFTNSSLVSGGSSGLFTIPVSNTAPKTTPTFGNKTTPSLFGISSSSTSAANISPFTASKADSTVVDSSFNKTTSSPKTETGGFQLSSSSNLNHSQVSSTIATTTNKSLFSSSTNSPGSTLFKIQSVSSTTTTNTGVSSKAAESKTEDTSDAKMTYYSKLKGLNESVSDWIKKHVVETPLCILTPIFNDYDKYLKEIQEEYHNAGGDATKKNEEKSTTPEKNTATFPSDSSSTPKPNSSLFANTTPASNYLIASKAAPTASEEKPAPPFSFGIKNIAPTSVTVDNNTPGFSFGIKTQSTVSTDKPITSPFGIEKSVTTPFVTEKSIISPFGTEKSKTSPFSTAKSVTSPFGIEKSGNSPFGTDKSGTSAFGTEKSKSSLFSEDKAATSPFSFSSNTSSSSAPAAPFSFGIGQKFSFSPNTQQQPETTSEQKNENEEDEPPKVEFIPVVEENSVFDKRCKVFVKKDGNFADKGVATLYIKKIENSAKHQLVVRANTNLGNVLVNLVLASAIPTQRMGKNNVMMVCIPTPDAKPPPTPILIRVKTSEEADELLETLNKYKA